MVTLHALSAIRAGKLTKQILQISFGAAHIFECHTAVTIVDNCSCVCNNLTAVRKNNYSGEEDDRKS
jgi:hypothetical protein